MNLNELRIIDIEQGTAYEPNEVMTIQEYKKLVTAINGTYINEVPFQNDRIVIEYRSNL